MAKPEVYVTRCLPLEALAMLKERCNVEMHSDPQPLSKAELLSKLKGRDAIVVSRTKIDEELCQAIEARCKILACYAVGYDNVDVQAATRHGIYVSNTPSAVTEATADLAFSLLLAAARRIVECDQYVRAGRKDWGLTTLLGTQVSGKTIGIVGGGRVGVSVGQRSRGFGMRVLYTDVRANPAFEEATGGRLVDKDTLLQEADFISLHLPLLATTRHFIGARELKLMKKTAILVNASRGPIVDEKALVAALLAGEIKGAGLDVYEREPEQEPGLTELPNVVLTPHVGTSTLDARIKMGESCARSIFAALNGQAVPNCLNPEASSYRQA